MLKWQVLAWCTPIISAREAETGGSMFETILGKKLARSHLQQISQAWWHMPVAISTTWEAACRRIEV
jgi:hypothetical protein